MRHNNAIHRNHFHKNWQTRIKCFFNQPAKKKKRRLLRKQKAASLAPRPVERLRPIVRCPTALYNIKQRLGRGFTPAELKAVGLNPHYARTIGIAVDLRRRNKSVEGMQINVQRLKEYKSKLILFPMKRKKPKKSRDEGKTEHTLAAMKLAKQYIGTIMPYKQDKRQEEPRAIQKCERRFRAVKALRKARNAVRYRRQREMKKAALIKEKQAASQGPKKKK